MAEERAKKGGGNNCVACGAWRGSAVAHGENWAGSERARGAQDGARLPPARHEAARRGAAAVGAGEKTARGGLGKRAGAPVGRVG